MALEYICKMEIFEGKRISIPEGARKFRTESGAIKFYSVNPSGSSIDHNKKIKKVPSDARWVVFEEFESKAYNIHYGPPTFYDQKDHVL